MCFFCVQCFLLLWLIAITSNILSFLANAILWEDTQHVAISRGQIDMALFIVGQLE